MTESRRRPVPRSDGGEPDTALAFLGFARESLLKKTEGLDEADLRRVLVSDVNGEQSAQVSLVLTTADGLSAGQSLP